MELTTRARSTARGALRAVYTGLSELTADLRMQPRFIIAGAQRCGTTSLFRMLAKHPEVRPPAFTKGIHYFDTADRFARGSRFYRAHFPLALGERGTCERVTGEASPYYLFHPLAPRRIAEELPDAKVIVLLRDPVERAFSAHKQETWRGFEALPFEEALDAEPARIAGEEERILADPTYQSFAHQHYAYVARGQYLPQLHRIAEAVGRDNLLVLDADRFFADPHSQWTKVLTHIGVREVPFDTPVKANARPSSPMSERTRAHLKEQFDASARHLAEFLGHPPSWL